ncbi:chemotaxis protein [Xaviernesmea oryzae]|uniref:Chemotaxis protein n=1 Tax=Xaviernesmea oryzae TaxID=464029 RepID=A0A1Q9ATF0_9HYPH|nr:methyl-accepting chemotaxis protein [Xaviernesmea oryzae]OLP58638.1 chemotaxis protein [Xaviernesmea oryzae]SEK65235.1 methyl-accepting chemotaxis sensory transducer with TarH sensor [Xaviernesmea oryzae]
MKNISILAKFLTLLAAFGLFTVAAALYSGTQLMRIDTSYSNLISGQASAATLVSRASRQLQAVRSSIGELLIARTEEDDKQALSELQDARDTFANRLEAAQVLIPNDGRISALKTEGAQTIEKACGAVIKAGATSLAEEDVKSSQLLFGQDCQPALRDLTKKIVALSNDLVSDTATASDNLTNLSITVARTTIIGVLLGLVIVLIAAFVSIRAWVVRPIDRMVGAMAKLANGDLGTDVPEADRGDEIGKMARTVAVFKENGLKTRQLEADAEAQRSRSDVERQRNAEAEARRAADMAKATTGLGEGLRHLASGDLTYELTEAFAADFETLRMDFNGAVAQLRESLSAVAVAASSIDSGASEVSRGADDLSKRTEQQAASLEETAAALDQITANVANSSKRADEARRVAQSANESATRSGSVVADAVNAMQRIEQSSGQIANIIGVIDEIAFQTNLLALNAGVEAARAGEAGKGFAVVAQEVRELAQRSAKAAKEIKELIRNSSGEVESGVLLVSQTGEVLKTIETYIVDINQHMDAIATSAREQSVGLAEVNTAVNQMDQVTQQNAAMVEETNAAGASLASDATRLREVIGRFRVGEGAAMPMASGFSGESVRRPANSSVAPRPMPVLKPRTAAPVAVAAHHIAKPSPARALTNKLAAAFSSPAPSAKSKPAADAWEEF